MQKEISKQEILARSTQQTATLPKENLITGSDELKEIVNSPINNQTSLASILIDKENEASRLNENYTFDEEGLIQNPTQVATLSEAKRLYEEGRLTEEGVLIARAWNNLAKGGLLDLDAQDANILYNTGLMSQKDADKLAEYMSSPTQYYIKNGITQVVGGVVDGLAEIGELAHYAKNKIDPTIYILEGLEKVLGEPEPNSLRDEITKYTKEPPKLYELSKLIDKDPSKALTTIRSLSQFLAPFGAVSKSIKGVKYLSNPVTKATTAGAITDFVAFDEHEQRLSDLIQSVPELRNPITEFLKSNKDDSLVMGRLKNTLEGIGLGLTFEGLLIGLKSVKANIWTKANNSQAIATDKIDALLKDKSTTQEIPLASKQEIKQPPLKEIDESIPITERIKDSVDFETHRLANEAKLNSKTPVTNEEVLKIADEYGVDLGMIKSVYKDTTNLNAKVVSIGNTIKEFGDALMTEIGAYKEAMQKGVDDITKELDLYAKILQHGKMQDIFRGISANIARGLNAHKLIYRGKEIDLKSLSREDLEQAVESLGGRDNLKSAINAFYESMSKSQKQGNAFSRGQSKATLMDWLNVSRFAGMLSSTGTHIANIAGNSAMMGVRDLEHLVALSGRSIKDMDLKHFKEYKYKTIGRMLGLIDALKISKFSKDGKNGSAIKAFMTATPQLDVGVKWMDNSSAKVPSLLNRYVDETGEFISKEARASKELTWKNWAGEVLGMWVFRLLTGVDEIFKSMSARGELYRQAIEVANEKGLKFGSDDEFRMYLNEVVNNPTQAQREQAINVARKETFTAPISTNNPFDRAKDPLAHSLASTSLIINAPVKFLNSLKQSSNPVISQASQIVVPFLNTPTNIFKESLRYTPLALFSRTWLSDFMAGGTRKAQAIAKVGLGITFMGNIASMYNCGIITGKHPKEERARYELARIPEYSIKIGDEWVSYQRLEPFATVMGLVVNVISAFDRNEVKPEIEQKATFAILGAIMDTMIDKSYMKGVKSVSTALGSIDENERNLEQFIGQTTTSYVPFNALIRQGQSAFDDYKRVKESPMDYVMGLLNQQNLEPVLDIFGEATTKMPKYLYAFEYGKTPDDKVVKEMVNVGFNLEPMKGKILKAEDSKFEMPIKERNAVKRLVKELGLKEALLRVIEDDSYQSLNLLEDKRAILHEVVSEFYNQATQIYTYSSDTKQAQIIKDLQDRVDAMLDPSLAQIRNKKINPTPIFK